MQSLYQLGPFPCCAPSMRTQLSAALSCPQTSPAIQCALLLSKPSSSCSMARVHLIPAFPIPVQKQDEDEDPNEVMEVQKQHTFSYWAVDLPRAFDMIQLRLHVMRQLLKACRAQNVALVSQSGLAEDQLRQKPSYLVIVFGGQAADELEAREEVGRYVCKAAHCNKQYDSFDIPDILQFDGSLQCVMCGGVVEQVFATGQTGDDEQRKLRREVGSGGVVCRRHTGGDEQGKLQREGGYLRGGGSIGRQAIMNSGSCGADAVVGSGLLKEVSQRGVVVEFVGNDGPGKCGRYRLVCGAVMRIEQLLYGAALNWSVIVGWTGPRPILASPVGRLTQEFGTGLLSGVRQCCAAAWNSAAAW
eukprot:1159831-Pelagomonas_calceolata.AAC.6